MAHRVTVSELRLIFDSELVNEELAAFIAAANTIVNDRLADKGLSAGLLAEIEKWLAAHLATARAQQAESEDIAGEYKVKYQGSYDLGLNGSRYGQMVLVLDSTGTLASAGQKRAGFQVFATPDPS